MIEYHGRGQLNVKQVHKDMFGVTVKVGDVVLYHHWKHSFYYKSTVVGIIYRDDKYHLEFENFNHKDRRDPQNVFRCWSTKKDFIIVKRKGYKLKLAKDRRMK